MNILDETVELDSVYSTSNSKSADDIHIAVKMRDGRLSEPIDMRRSEARTLARLILEALEKD